MLNFPNTMATELLTSVDFKHGAVEVSVKTHRIDIEDLSLSLQNGEGCLYTV